MHGRTPVQRILFKATPQRRAAPAVGSWVTDAGVPEGVHHAFVRQYPVRRDQAVKFHQVALIYETWHNARRIYTDGRQPGPDGIGTRMGYSVGHWDGETLVVETTHLLPMLLTWDGHPISGGGATRIVERISRTGNELTIDYTLEDPVYWEEPLTREVTYRYAPDLEIVDYHCDPVNALDWRYPD